ncbi:alpha/beta fold hydrolase [Nonomuraea ferruginea]
MNTVISRDGTTIAYTRTGQGPALLLADGAMCYRASGPNTPLAQEMADTHTVYTYDRRGRGESGDTTPFAPRAGDRGHRRPHRDDRRAGLPVRHLLRRRAGPGRRRERAARQQDRRVRAALHRRRHPPAHPRRLHGEHRDHAGPGQAGRGDPLLHAPGRQPARPPWWP